MVVGPLAADGESSLTAGHRCEWEKQRAVVGHFEQQLKVLKSKQRTLVHTLSNGLDGDVKATIAHVSAITRALQDIETLEARVRDRSLHANARRWDYLMSRNSDDERVLAEAQGTLMAAKGRLEEIDPTEINGIRTEQAMIRLSKERVALLQNAIAARAQEMEELAALAKLCQTGLDNKDEFDPEGSCEPSEGGVGTGQKGKKKTNNGKRKRLGKKSPGTEAIGDRDGSHQAGVDTDLTPPVVHRSLSPSLPPPMIGTSDTGSSDDAGEDLGLERE